MARKTNNRWQRRYPQDPGWGILMDIIDNHGLFGREGGAKAINSAMQKAVRDADVSAAFLLGMKVGGILDMAVFKDRIQHSDKSKIALAGGRSRKAAATTVRHAHIRDAVTARLKKHPCDSVTYARQIVADEMKVSFGTVRTATRDMKTRPKKTKE